MADEEIDSLDSGLDNFGGDSEFSDQLDDFMESDVGGQSGGDADSELDSFFEDLSTIDDLEVKAEEAPPPAPEPEPEAAAEPEPEPEPEPKERKPILIPALIAGGIGVLLGIITVIIWYFINKPPEPEPETTTTTTTVEVTTMVTTSTTTTTVPEVVPLPPPPVPKKVAAPPPPPKKTKYYVQVATCVHKECVEDYRYLLKRFGYEPFITSTMEKTSMSEVISRQSFTLEDSSRWVKRINQENQLTGEAYRVPSDKRYKISLGLFPDLTTATKVRTHLNQLYAAQLVFDTQKAEQTLHFQKIRAGGLDNKAKAAQMQAALMELDKRFQGAFVISELE